MALPVIAAASLALGAYQYFDSMHKRKQLGKRPELSIDPATTAWGNVLQERTKQGLSGSQQANILGSISRGQNFVQQQAQNMGGGAGLGALGAAAGIRGRLGLGAMDTEQQNRNIAAYSPWVQYQQGLLDRKTIGDQRYYDQQLAGIQGEQNAGINNAVGSLNLTQALNYGLDDRKVKDSMGFGGSGSDTGNSPWLNYWLKNYKSQ